MWLGNFSLESFDMLKYVFLWQILVDIVNSYKVLKTQSKIKLSECKQNCLIQLRNDLH